MKKHPLLTVFAAVIALLFLVVLLVPLFVNANNFRGTLEPQLSSAVGRKVTLGNLSFSILSGSLTAGNVAIADNPAFGTQPFLQAASLHIGVEVLPLLLHRQLLVTSFVADSPTIHLVRNATGTWNFSDMGRTAGSRTPNSKTEGALPNFAVGKLEVVNGTATVSNQPPTGASFVYSKVNLTAEQFSFAKAFPFTVSAVLPGEGVLNVKGTAGPVSIKDASDTPLNATIDLKHFDPVAAGAIQASQGIAMLANVEAQVTSNGELLNSKGTVHATGLKVATNGVPAPTPVDIAYTVQQNLDARTGQISDLAIQSGAVAVHVAGTYNSGGPQTVLALRLAAPNLPIDQVEALLPAAGVLLPSGSKLRGGTLTANLAIAGAANAPTISGPIQVDNTRLMGFDLASKIGGLKPGGVPSQGGTQIQTLKANVNSSSQGTRIDNLYTSIPLVGTATGAGTVSPQGGLNFQVTAKINAQSGLLGGLSAAGGLLGQAVSSAAADGIPVHITGTTTNPVIQADVNKLLQKNAGNILKQQLLGGNGKGKPNAGSVLNQLFHH